MTSVLRPKLKTAQDIKVRPNSAVARKALSIDASGEVVDLVGAHNDNPLKATQLGILESPTSKSRPKSAVTKSEKVLQDLFPYLAQLSPKPLIEDYYPGITSSVTPGKIRPSSSPGVRKKDEGSVSRDTNKGQQTFTFLAPSLSRKPPIERQLSQSDHTRKQQHRCRPKSSGAEKSSGHSNSGSRGRGPASKTESNRDRHGKYRDPEREKRHRERRRRERRRQEMADILHQTDEYGLALNPKEKKLLPTYHHLAKLEDDEAENEKQMKEFDKKKVRGHNALRDPNAPEKTIFPSRYEKKRFNQSFKYGDDEVTVVYPPPETARSAKSRVLRRCSSPFERARRLNGARRMVYAYNLPDVNGERGYDAYYSYYSSSAYPNLGSGTHVTSPNTIHGQGASSAHAHRAKLTKDPFSGLDVSSHIVSALNSTGNTQRYDVNHDTMFQNPNSQCFVKPIEEGGVGAMAIMFIFISAVVVGAIPQYVKLVVLGNADGLSMSSLALLNLSCWSASLNVFILHFDQIKFCIRQEVEYTIERCEASMLTLYYTLVYTLLWFPLYPLAASYCSDRKKMFMRRLMTEKNIAWMGWFAHGIPCLALAAPVVRMVVWHGCTEFESYAVALGLLNAVLEAIRYVPQVWESWKFQGSGSMSYARLVLSVAGGLGACIQKAKMHESASTWAPPLVGHGLEMIILVINLYYDAIKRKEKKNSREKEGYVVGVGVGDKSLANERESLLVHDAPSETEGVDEHSDEDDARSQSSHATADVESSAAASNTNKNNKKKKPSIFMSRKAKKQLAVQQAELRVKEELAFLDAKREEWVEEFPEDKREHIGYFCHNLRNNPKFWKGLVKYM